MSYECDECKKPVSAGMLFCPYCGEKFPNPVPSEPADVTPETFDSVRPYQETRQPQAPAFQSPSNAEKKKMLIFVKALVTVGGCVVLFIIIGLFRSNKQPTSPTGVTRTNSSFPTMIPTLVTLHKQGKPKQVAETHIKTVAIDKQKPVRYRRTTYSGKLPAVTVSPTVSGFQDDVVDPFINRAYPGCQIKVEDSDRHSWVVDYKVTEPSGRKVYAVCSFVWNGGGLPDDWRDTPGHYELTEGRDEADAEKKADRKDKLAQANKQPQVAQIQQPQEIQGNEDDVYSAIKAKVRQDFPNDYFMQKSAYDLQVSAYHYMQNLPANEIKAKVQQDFPNDYFMQKSAYELQLKSKQDMQ